MIKYNRKFLNIATLCMFIYVVYAAKKHDPRLFSDFQSGLTKSSSVTTHSMTIDPQKPNSQKNMLEKAVTFLFRDDIERAVKMASHNGVNQYGDKITYLFEQHFEGEEPGEPSELNYIIGVTQGPSYLSPKFRDAKIGEKMEFTEHNEGKIKKVSIEIKNIKKSTLVN